MDIALKQILETFNTPSVIIDDNFKIVSCNSQFNDKVTSKREFLSEAKQLIKYNKSSNKFDIEAKPINSKSFLIHIKNMQAQCELLYSFEIDYQYNIISSTSDASIPNTQNLKQFLSTNLMQHIDKCGVGKQFLYTESTDIGEYSITMNWTIFKSETTIQLKCHEEKIRKQIQSTHYTYNISEILMLSKLGYAIYDMSRSDRKPLEYNKYSYEYLGLSEQEFIGEENIDNEWKVVDEDGNTFSKMPYDIAYEDGLIVENMRMVVWRPSANDWVWIDCTAIPDRTSQTVIVIYNNVSEQILNKKLSQQNEHYFQTLFQNSPIGVAILNEDKIEYANKIMQQYTSDEPKKSLYNFIQDSCVDLKSINHTIQKIELKLKQSKNVEYYVLATFVPLQDDNKVLTMFRDITDYKRVNAELQRQTENLEQIVQTRTNELMIAKQLYKTISEEVPTGIWKSDLDGNIEYGNPLFKSLIGDNENILDIFSNDEDRTKFKNSLESDSKFEMVFQKISNDEELWFRIKFFKIDDGFIGMTDNMTSEFTTIHKLMNLKKEINDELKSAKR